MNVALFRSVGGFTAIYVALVTAVSTSAQVYSINAVGYADIDFVAGSNLVANPFCSADNSISNLFRGAPDGAMFLPGHGGAIYSFEPTNLYTAASGWTRPSEPLVAPNGGFLWLPSATRFTFVGDALWPSIAFTSGWIRWVVQDRFPEIWPPIFCGSITDPCPQGQVPEWTQFYKWNRVLQKYEIYTYLSTSPGIEPYLWYDEGFNPGNPQLGIGEAGLFWVPEQGTPHTWTRGGGVVRNPVTLARPERRGTNLTFQFNGEAGNAFALLRSTNLSQRKWEVAQSGSVTSANQTVSLDMSPHGTAFYRLEPPFDGQIVLMHPTRTNSTFRFEFHAPATATYTVLQKPQLSAQTWQTVTTLPAQSNTVVSVADMNATGATGYYVVRQSAP